LNYGCHSFRFKTAGSALDFCKVFVKFFPLSSAEKSAGLNGYPFGFYKMLSGIKKGNYVPAHKKALFLNKKGF